MKEKEKTGNVTPILSATSYEIRLKVTESRVRLEAKGRKVRSRACISPKVPNPCIF